MLKAVIFDWAGTTVDFGCFAPIHAFLDAFESLGLTPTIAETRAPMGMLKIDHIRTMLQMPRLVEEFAAKYDRAYEPADVEQLYARFEEVLFRDLDQYATPIENVCDIVYELRVLGLKIGSTTGYTADMMDVVAPAAKKLGYYPDYLSTSSITGKGRPAPDMIFDNLRKLGVEFSFNAVKVGDTISDIQEGYNAGAWSVGVLKGSSQMGLTSEEYAAQPDHKLAEQTRSEFMAAGADYVLEDITELPALILAINKRLKQGERPGGYEV